MAGRPSEAARLKRGVVLLGAAGLFFLVSMVTNLATGGSLRAIDVAVPLWGLLFAAYWRRWRAAARRDRRE